ncbi:hypothetical protein G6F64_013516 [Rhizopus arrhizus]|uniref:Uncharacterized protein n=1 Tax=Rhizopus oryzae TaxID=64495 RepID=A0A9P7BKD9_RHIOR|nr:hypothetical protein G6F64_013516 [Rhizopus arrhizus]
MSPLETIPLLNCLLYADDVVLIAERTTMTGLLRVPFKPEGYLDPDELIRRNSSKELATMNVLNSIVRPQLEYGLAINRFTNTQLKSIEDVQDTCIREIYGARGKTSTKHSSFTGPYAYLTMHCYADYYHTFDTFVDTNGSSSQRPLSGKAYLLQERNWISTCSKQPKNASCNNL